LRGINFRWHTLGKHFAPPLTVGAGGDRPTRYLATFISRKAIISFNNRIEIFQNFLGVRTMRRKSSPSERIFFFLIILIAALILSACNEDDISSLPEATGGNAQTFVGVQTNVPESAIIAGGWNLCHQDGFGDTANSLSTILSNCSGSQLMLACRDVGNPNLVAVAHAPRVAVTTDTGNADNGISTVSNGVAWYFNTDWSWGFFEPGDGVSKNNCDIGVGAFPERRMCAHTSLGNLDSGYRCGATENLFDNSWERLIYTNS